MKKYAALILCVFLLGNSDCEPSGGSSNAAEEKQREKTNQMQNEAYRQVGMPELTNFQELKFAK